MFCKICNVEIFYSGRGRPRKYCIKCSDFLDRKHKILYKKRLREQRRIRGINIGTTDFSSHFCGNFLKEYKEIQKEIVISYYLEIYLLPTPTSGNSCVKPKLKFGSSTTITI